MKKTCIVIYVMCIIALSLFISIESGLVDQFEVSIPQILCIDEFGWVLQ